MHFCLSSTNFTIYWSFFISQPFTLAVGYLEFILVETDAGRSLPPEKDMVPNREKANAIPKKGMNIFFIIKFLMNNSTPGINKTIRRKAVRATYAHPLHLP